MRDAAGKPFKCAPATLRELRKIKKRMRPKVGSGLAGVHPFTVTDQPQVTNVKCCFCQKAFNALLFFIVLLPCNPCDHPGCQRLLKPHRRGGTAKGAMTQQFYYLNGQKIHIYALRFEAWLTLIDINDDDDAESGCCHAHSYALRHRQIEDIKHFTLHKPKRIWLHSKDLIPSTRSEQHLSA